MDALGLRAMEILGVGLSADDLAHGVVDGMLACEPMPDGVRIAVAYVAWDEYPPPSLHDGRDGRGRVVQVDAGDRGDVLARDFTASAVAAGLSVHEAPGRLPGRGQSLRGEAGHGAQADPRGSRRRGRCRAGA